VYKKFFTDTTACFMLPMISVDEKKVKALKIFVYFYSEIVLFSFFNLSNTVLCFSTGCTANILLVFVVANVWLLSWFFCWEPGQCCVLQCSKICNNVLREIVLCTVCSEKTSSSVSWNISSKKINLNENFRQYSRDDADS